MTLSTLEHALAYAARGWRVVPIPAGQKYPAHKDWPTIATTNPERITNWWSRHDDGIGIVTGAESGLFILDIDPRSGGDDSLQALEQRHGALPDTVESITGSGGRHLLFAWPTTGGIRNSASGVLGVGIDVRGEGGQFVAPPSVHANGQRYAWEIMHDPLDGVTVADAPAWLLELLTQPPRIRPARRDRGELGLDPTPGDVFEASTSWPELLEPDGWRHHSTHTDATGAEYELWTRPGKPDGVSASLYWGGSDVLKVFTSSVPYLHAEETYTRFGYLAARGHGGDHSEAARALRRAMNAATAPPTPPAPPSTGGEKPETPPPPERPSIVHNGRQLDELTRHTVNVLALANDPPQLFVRAGMATRLRADEDARPLIEPLTKDTCRHRLAEVADWHRVNKDGERTSTAPPVDLVANILAAKGWPFPPLTGIAEVPILRPDGTFHADHGYDHATRLYHWRVAEYPTIPEHPTALELDQAIAVVHDVLADFPFDTSADRANAWALLLTGIVRPAVDGQVPMALLDAPEPGTGKSLLARVATMITTGRPGAMRAMPDDEAELRKAITAMLLAGTTTVIFDNVDGVIKSPTLAGALTADVWRDRILGATQDIEIPSRVTWLATGNNIAVGGDLARRCYRIRLDARQAQPWRRTGFRHTDLENYVNRNRPTIVAALCTIVRAWWSAGRPTPGHLPALGGYTPWVRIVGGILHHAGIGDFLGNLEAFHADADREAMGWEAFLHAWYDAFTDEVLTVGTLVRRLEDQQGTLGAAAVVEALPDDLSPSWGTSRFSTRLGRALAQRAGRHYGDGGLHVVRHGADRTKVMQYSVTHAAAGVHTADDTTPAARDALTSNGTSTAGDAGDNPFVGTFSGYPLDKSQKVPIAEQPPRTPATPAASDEPDFELW